MLGSSFTRGQRALVKRLLRWWLFVFVSVLGSFPIAIEAAEAVYRVGVLALGSAASNAADLRAMRDRLNDLGYIEGRNLVIEDRYADRQAERLPTLAADLVRLKVDAIVTITTPAAKAAKNATENIPIVMAGSAEPVELGLIQSLARPGGNVTGVTNSAGPDFPAKQLQLLKEAAPKVTRVAVLMTSSPVELRALNAMQNAAATLGVTPLEFLVDNPAAVDLQTIAQLRADALYVFPNATNDAHREAILAYAAANGLPAIYGERAWVEAGGLMSYWTDWLALRRRAADFVDKIFKGARPGDLPVERPTKFELVINLKSAKTLHLTIPQSVLLRANEVIR